jgi:hypothetical protein
MNSFDIDGVIYMGEYDGVYPGPKDVIITGRSFEEERETLSMLAKKGIYNMVYFNILCFHEKTRESSGHHKTETLLRLIAMGNDIGIHFEDDPIQAKIIEDSGVDVKVVLLTHNLVEKENVRHL